MKVRNWLLILKAV